MPLLTGGPSDAPAHQRTLRTTIGWSYDLLEPEHRQLLRLLAVFPVGCPLDLLLDVATSDAGGGTDPDSGGKDVVILDQLAALVAQSLLIHEDDEDGRHRFRMLDTIREFAGEEALACDEIEANRCRLAHAVVRLAAEAYHGMEGPEQMSWLSRLDRELETIRAVMVWTAEDGDAALGADLAFYLWGGWLGRSLSREALSWVERLIPRLDAERAPIGRIRALFVAGAMATRRGEGESRRAYLEEARSLAEAHGALRELGSILGFLAINGGGRELARAATTAGRRIGEPVVLVPKLITEAIIIARLADREAELLLEECLALLQETSNVKGLADLNYFRATYVDVPRGDFEQARERFERALETYRLLGHRERWCDTIVQLARIAVTEGDVDGAAALYSEGLVAAQHLGDLRTIGWGLDGKAWVALHRGRMETAVRLAGATLTWRTRFGISYPVLVPAFGVAEEALARAALGIEAFAAEWSAGQAMPIDAAIGAALAG
jgi:tetratricopeptide (TPR) repeat protein